MAVTRWVRARMRALWLRLRAAKWFDPRANWYRDAWMLVITFFVALTVNKTSGLVGDIQASRVQSCAETTRRHDATIARLDAQLDRATRRVGAVRAAQIRQSRDFTVSLIDQLAPPRSHQQCETLVQAP